MAFVATIANDWYGAYKTGVSDVYGGIKHLAKDTDDLGHGIARRGGRAFDDVEDTFKTLTQYLPLILIGGAAIAIFVLVKK